jgi:ketosteroid isomerase-like protein
VSLGNVEIARRVFTAGNRRPKPDFATLNALVHPDHELVSLVRFRQAGLRGARGYREFLADMDETYESSWESKIDEARELDDERVLLIADYVFRGKRSGATVKQQMGIVMTLRDGKVVRSESFPSRQEAFDALGLKDGDVPTSA